MRQTTESRGCVLSYKVEGQGDPVVLIQGVGLHGDGWLPQTRSLSSHFRCLTFDNRGMGKSQPAAVEITVEQLAEDTLAVMDAAGMGAAHIVGHSLGGVVALQLALSARQRVNSLSLLCTSACGWHATRLTLPMVWLGMRSRIGTRRMRAHAFLQIVMPPAFLATQDRDLLVERLEPIFGHHLADTPPIVMPQLKALKRFDARARLKELKGISTLVLSAEGDLIFPPMFGKRLAAGIPGARFVGMPGTAHGVTIQSADAVNRLLLEHLRAGTGGRFVTPAEDKELR
jgi:pimeloyl-ACP methyl ester carboxylesterase